MESTLNYICPACGGLVQEARRQVHTERWCPSLAGDDSDSDAIEDRPIPLEVLALLSPQYAAEITPELSFAPGAALHVAQSNQDLYDEGSRHSDHATAGQLWWSEMVLAEYLALRARRPADGPSGVGKKAVAVALGCGSAPVSAYVAAMLGWDTLCTDLPEVLPMTQQNSLTNHRARQAAHQAIAPGCMAGCLDFLPLTFGEPLPKATSEWLEAHGGIRLILCSDCIWEAHRHRPLADTLTQLLSPSGSEALIAYQMREGDELQFFSIVEHFNLQSERMDVTEAIRRVRFPKQFGRNDPCAHFCVHRVWKRAETTTQ